MKQMTMIGAAVGLLLSVPAAAQTVQVPCEEFVQITGQKMACDKIPMLKMQQEVYEQEKAAYETRQCLEKAGEADLPPWKRSGKCDAPAQPEPKTVSETNPCSLPPWKWPKGAKCK